MRRVWLILLFGLFLAGIAVAQVVPGRYIVELTGEPSLPVLAQSGGRREAAPRERLRVAGEQRTARLAIEGRGGRVLASTDTVSNALIVSLPAEQAPLLAATPGIAHVYPVRMVRATLNRVLPLHRVPDAWSRLGGADKAGAGIRIGILDSGIDSTHPGFQDSSLTPPQGFPITSSDANKVFVNSKVIVARSYEDLNDGSAWGTDARDLNGHGTGVAMAAAGVIHTTPFQVEIAGIAPKAFLGNYRVLGASGGGTNAGILKAIDDAVKDGMDVLNMSLGADQAPNPDDDPTVKAVTRVVQAGVVVVCAAGNAGSDLNTINSPGLAALAIAVGSSGSDRSVDPPKQLDPNRISGFSSRGPNLGDGLKPDIVAVGDNFFTADSTLKSNSNGYTVTQGTSFASPVVAGAAAVLKGARPGLTARDYRALLIGSTTALAYSIRDAGAGVLNLDAALQATITAYPTSVKFGVGDGSPSLTREITLGNTGTAVDTYTLTVEPISSSVFPTLSSTSLTVGAGSSVKVIAALSGSGLAPGEYQGFIRVRGANAPVDSRIPYWYAVPSNRSDSISLLDAVYQGAPGSEVRFAFRVVDASGLVIANAAPEVSMISGGGAVLEMDSLAPDIPDAFGVRLKLGADPGDNVFRIKAGDVVRDVTIGAAK